MRTQSDTFSLHDALPIYAVLGPIIVRVASFFPFPATYWLNGHSFIEQELKRKKIDFRKNDNAFLAVDNVAELQDRKSTRMNSSILSIRFDTFCLLKQTTS